MNDLTPMPVGSAITLAEHAEAIRVLGRQTVANVIEIGRRLTEAKAVAGHGGWLPWLEREFGWNVRVAQNFMRVHELSKSENFSHLEIPVSGLYLLAAPSTPESAREEVIAAAKSGKRITVADVERAVSEAREAARAEALEAARAEARQDLFAAESEKQAAIEELERVRLRTDAKVSAAEASVSDAKASLAEAQAKSLQAKIDADAARAEIKSAIDAATEAAITGQAETIKSLRAEMKAKEAAVRAEYSGKFVFTEGELDAKVDELLKPFNEKIEEQERQIAALKNANAKPRPSPRIDPGKVRASGRIRAALSEFVEASALLSAADLIAFERETAKVTESDIDKIVSRLTGDAAKVRRWTDGIIQQS